MTSENPFNDFTFTSSSSSTSFDGLPAFFTNGSVDDTKYESLLADLRAHDLLGPVDAAEESSSFGGNTSSSSLFFNDAFSAVFMGNFSDSSTSFRGEASASSASLSTGSSMSSRAITGVASKPPPGFQRAPPGLAPSETDLKWARGQQEFSRIEEKFNHHTITSGPTPVKNRDEGELAFDENMIPSLRSLGLDDDELLATPVKKTTPPVPSTETKPAWQPSASQQPPPPPAGFEATPRDSINPPLPPSGPSSTSAWQNHVHQQVPPPPPHPHQMPPPPPHPHMGMPPHHVQGGPPPPHMHPAYMHGSPPPQGMPFPRPLPFMAGPPPPPPQYMAAPVFKMMTPRDINFVIQQQMKQIRSSDPFSDDYYFHNYVQKRTRAMTSGGPSGPRPPLPSWKLQHIKSIDPRDAQRAVKSRNWENEFQVLGHNQKSSLYRPKQLLNLSAASSPSSSESNPEETPRDSPTNESSNNTTTESTEEAATVLRMSKDASHNSVFSNETWQRRLQIDRGMQCLLSLQDARHLLDARGVNVQQFHSMDDSEMDPALAELRTRTTTLLLELAALLGVSVTPETRAMQCNVPQLHNMLVVTKGKKLVSRALPLLHPSARFVLLPQLVEYLLSAHAVERFAGSDVIDEGDERLCQTLVLMLLYHPPAPSAELLTESLQRALDGHNIQTLSLVLHNRARAEALQALLQRGGTAIQHVESDELKQQWNHYQGLFVSLATAIRGSSS